MTQPTLVARYRCSRRRRGTAAMAASPTEGPTTGGVPGDCSVTHETACRAVGEENARCPDDDFFADADAPRPSAGPRA